MKRSLRSRFVAAILVFVTTVWFAGCGIILYPERRGRVGGRPDVVVVVLDCLWLFAGIVPGVAALLVDFVTGGIYDSRYGLNVHPGQRLAFNLSGPAAGDATIAVTIESSDGSRILATLLSEEVMSGEEIPGPLAFFVPPILEAGSHRLVLRVNGAANADWPLNVSQ